MRNRLILIPLLAALACAAHAQVTVSDSWVRGTVAHQSATGLFFNITSTQGSKLVAAASPAARVVQLHKMTMDGDVMRMRQVPAIDLPAGKTVSLTPGGFHVMLIDVVKPLSAGDTVPATLTVEDAAGHREQVQVTARVEALGAPHANGTMGNMARPRY
jgi:periplasmic copper chaperone A